MLVLNWRDPWHPEGGGSELYVHQVVRRLVARGHHVTVFTAAYAVDGVPAPRSEVREGIRYVRRGGHLTIYLWAAALLTLGRLGRLGRRLAGLGRVDRVLEVQNGMPFLSTLFTSAPVTVLVHHVHREQWPVVGPVLARIGWFLESRAAVRANRGNRYVAVSEVTRTELVDLGVRAGDIVIAYNGTPPILRTAGIERAADPRLVVLSRLVPHKQIEHAITLMPRLLSRWPEATLHVLGSGWWHDHLLALRDELGLGDRVVFHGHVCEEQKFAELERSWLHVLPSVKEGWGLSIIEAAAVGTPSIAYRSAGGVQESILEGVTGALAEDPEDLARQVEELLADDERRIDLAAKAEARAGQFHWDATADRIERALFDA